MIIHVLGMFEVKTGNHSSFNEPLCHLLLILMLIHRVSNSETVMDVTDCPGPFPPERGMHLSVTLNTHGYHIHSPHTTPLGMVGQVSRKPAVVADRRASLLPCCWWWGWMVQGGAVLDTITSKRYLDL